MTPTMQQQYRMRHAAHQRGFSLINMIIWGILLVIVVAIGSQTIPIFNELIAVKRASKRLAESATNANEVINGFSSQMSIDSVYTFDPRTELIVTSGKDGKVRITYDYTREIPIWGPMYLTFKFYGQEG